MKFSFETPKSLLNYSRTFNDYEYFLDIFWDDHPEVFDFFLDSIMQGREVILDNSLYERKIRNIELDEEGYKNLLRKFDEQIPEDRKKLLKVIVPDYFEDSARCIRKVHEYLAEFPQFTLVAVVHGHNKQNFKDCFVEYTKILREEDVIAVPFGDMCCNTTPRSEILEELANVITWNQKVHFLGLKSPFEVTQIRRVRHLIDSIDTSYPVISSIEQNRVFNHPDKPKTLIYDIFDTFEPSDEFKELLGNNVQEFKQMLS